MKNKPIVLATVYGFFAVLISSCSNAEDINKLIRKGTAEMYAAQYVEAINDYSKVIELKPDFDSVYWFRANVYKLSADYNNALKDCNKAIELNPKFVHAYNSRAIVRGILSDFKGELEDLNKTIELDSTYYKAFYNRGNIWFDRNDFQKAIEDYTHAIRLKSDYFIAFYNRANAYDELKKYNEALADYESFFKYRDDSSQVELLGEAYFMRANDKFLLGDFAGACQDWQQSSEHGYTLAHDSIIHNCKK